VAELVAAATNTTTGAASPCAAATPPPRAGREIGDSTGDPNPMTSTTRSATQFADSRSNRKPIAQKKFEAIFFVGFSGWDPKIVGSDTKYHGLNSQVSHTVN
jgi:hypothetical protein